jgi:hypothetical protein
MTTHYVRHTSGSTLYAKPLPLVASPWASDIVSLTETGSTGSYSIDLDSDTPHEVFVRAGASPAATDEAIALIDPRGARDLQRIPRAADPIPAGEHRLTIAGGQSANITATATE